MDFMNRSQGLWGINQAYKLLFYSHVYLGIGMMITILIFWAIKPSSPEQVTKVHYVFNFSFALYCLIVSVLVSGWIAQGIHSQISVFILVCFSIAIAHYLTPLKGLLLYGSSYSLFIFLLTVFQNNPDVLQGHYINATISVIICYVLSQVLYKMKTQDLAHKNNLEDLVSQRTANLQQVNLSLENEINQRKQAHDKLLRLASIVENTDDGIIGMSLDGKVIDWNLGAELIFGYQKEEIIEKSIKLIFSPTIRDQIESILSNAAVGQSIIFEPLCIKRNNDPLNILATVSPFRNSAGTIIGVSIIARDITASRKVEREMARLQQLNLIGEMAASISHEVRNPMTTVKGFLQVLNEKEDCVHYRDYFDLMISEIDRANTIISEFLAISKNTATELSDCRLDKIVEQLLPLIKATALQVDINVDTELNQTVPVPLNDKEVRQIILNLAKNGIEAMPPGGVLTIKTFTTDNKVVLSISDQGTGIEMDIMEKLGTPFFSTKEYGTGLGLAVCYGIIERHHAKIDITTGQGGTTFSVSFPVPKINIV